MRNSVKPAASVPSSSVQRESSSHCSTRSRSNVRSGGDGPEAVSLKPPPFTPFVQLAKRLTALVGFQPSATFGTKSSSVRWSRSSNSLQLSDWVKMTCVGVVKTLFHTALLSSTLKRKPETSVQRGRKCHSKLPNAAKVFAF